MFDNIVMISLDTLRSDVLGMGEGARWKKIYPGLSHQPNAFLKNLFESGICFPNCFSAAPYTGASHGAILSGRWPLKNGLYELYNSPIVSPTIFEYFRKLGYKTVMSTDFPFILGEYLQLNRGVDHYFIEDEYSALDQVNNKTLSMFHFGGIHYPYGFHKLRFGGDAYRSIVDRLESSLGIEKLENSDRLVESYYGPEDYNILMRYKNVIKFLYGNGNYEQLFSLYLDGIDFFVENRFKRFMEQLLTRLEGSNYLIVVFSDHGEEWSQESEGHYNTVSPGVLNVPLAFITNSLRPRFVQRPCRTIDILPSIFDLSSIDPPRDLDGKSLFGKAEQNSPICFGQSWIARDFARLNNIRGKMMTRGGVENNNNIRHRLHREIAFLGNAFLERRHSSGRVSLHPGSLSNEEISSSEINRLDELLNMYNKNRPVLQQSTNHADGAVRDLLNNLGYKLG